MSSADIEEKDDSNLVGVFKQKLPKEDPNDPFDRQRCIQGWKQSIIEKQTCLVLGVGGIGCTVAMALARLGVGRIILIDYDKVECSNLNRQILFTLNDVGKLKVDAASENLKKYHIISKITQIETYNTDVIKNWSLIVKLAKKSTVIFNNIDYGGGFDIAAIAMAMKLCIPYSSGSSYCHSWIVEYFTGKSNIHSSFSYDNPEIDKETFGKLAPNKILEYNDLTFIPKDDNPPTRLIGSSPLCAVTGGMMTVNAWIQGIVQEDKNHTMPNFSKMDICHYWDDDDLIAWPMPTIEDSQSTVQKDENGNVVTDEYVFYENDSFLSCFPFAPFTVNNVKYFCVEQYLMAEKAKLMGDEKVFQQILNIKWDNDGGQKIKSLGRQIKPWDQNKWDANKEKIYYTGNYHKYTQNPHLRLKLLSYDAKKIFVKGGKKDKVWAVGIDINDERIKNKSNWEGSNLSGRVVTRIRDEISRQNKQRKIGVITAVFVTAAYLLYKRK